MQDDNSVPWKNFLIVTSETLIAFFLSTFSLAMFFVHRPANWIPYACVLLFLYLFVIFVCIKRVVNTLPISALMLIVPIAPLIALMIVISLIPIIQFLK